METSVKLKSAFIETIAILHILLFVYAAISKLLDFEKFQVQLGQSPIVSSYAGFLSFGVPILEILISIMLAFKATRKIGLFAGFSLMVMFSAYIFIMLHFSPFIPCSCGGILEKMGWNTHLYFNLGYVIAAGAALVLIAQTEPNTSAFKVFIRLLLLAIGSILLIAVLFISSENTSHQRNNFTRTFPQRPALGKALDLGYPSYYIAGASPSGIYLGNKTAPLTVTEIDSSLQKKVVHIIQIPPTRRQYKSLTVSIKLPYFYVSDGVKAFIYRGLVRDWKAKIWADQQAYFLKMVPIDSSLVAIRSLGGKNNSNIIGTITVDRDAKVLTKDNLLTHQIDGQFDTDGSMVYNSQFNTILYTYHYRNEYLQIAPNLTLIASGNTIDTNSVAKMKVRYVESMKGSKMATPVVTVNKRTATFGRYLYVHAGLMGRYEPRDTWNTSSVIDVYDFRKKRYEFSFYIDDKHQKKVKDFWVEHNRIYTLQGNHLVTHRFRQGFY